MHYILLSFVWLIVCLVVHRVLSEPTILVAMTTGSYGRRKQARLANCDLGPLSLVRHTARGEWPIPNSRVVRSPHSHKIRLVRTRTWPPGSLWWLAGMIRPWNLEQGVDAVWWNCDCWDNMDLVRSLLVRSRARNSRIRPSPILWAQSAESSVASNSKAIHTSRMMMLGHRNASLGVQCASISTICEVTLISNDGEGTQEVIVEYKCNLLSRIQSRNYFRE